MSWLTRYLAEAIELEENLKQDERTLGSYLIVLLTHMLKCRYQSSYENKSSWRGSIHNSFDKIMDTFGYKLAGTLYKKSYMREMDLNILYRKALRKAVEETGYPKEAFPRVCPWTKEQLVDATFIDNFIEEYGYGKKER